MELALATGRRGTALSVALGPDPALVSTREKPVARFHFTTDSGLEGTCRWVTDETCVRVCMDGIAAWLRAAIGS